MPRSPQEVTTRLGLCFVTLLIFALVFFGYSPSSVASSKQYSFNVMGPLAIGNPFHLNPNPNAREWQELENQLRLMKNLGVNAITTDIWWGVVEAREGVFNWSYYDRLVALLERTGLRWIPILSFHQCGGNVGDDCDVPIPSWIWSKAEDLGLRNADDLRFHSEQGNWSREYIAFWATPAALPLYQRFLENFAQHFRSKAHLIDEINISLGPSGELRYPSYNSHDRGAGYPTRGSLQAYSPLAIDSFQYFIQNKYHNNIQNLRQSWGFQLNSFNQVYPPNPRQLSTFYARSEHFSAYGRDFFDWYHMSMAGHGVLLMSTAQDILSGYRQFRNIELGAKIPGIHWRTASDRLAELSAGLIRTSEAILNPQLPGRGYRNIVAMIAHLNRKFPSNRAVLHFTCLEKDNWEDGQQAQSLAKDLVFWIGQESALQGVPLKGENAIAGPLNSERAWLNMRDALTWGNYSGLTLLRIQTIFHSRLAQNRLAETIRDYSRRTPPNFRGREEEVFPHLLKSF